MTKMQPYLLIDPRTRLGDHQRAVRLLRAAASQAGQSDARRQWIRAATQC
ncbi:hypothetical protein [Mycolicibacter minnesotensis]